MLVCITSSEDASRSAKTGHFSHYITNEILMLAVTLAFKLKLMVLFWHFK